MHFLIVSKQDLGHAGRKRSQLIYDLNCRKRKKKERLVKPKGERTEGQKKDGRLDFFSKKREFENNGRFKKTERH